MSWLVSVIVPVYNAQDYLRKCIKSIINQSYKNLEIILVDDGSDDGTFCDAFALEDNRVTVIHKNNGGLSSARNVGISHAKGDFITFIDSDDYVNRTYVEQMVRVAQETSAQIVQCEMKIVHNYDVILKERKIETQKIVCNGRSALLNRRYKVSACAKLYRRDIFDDVLFPEGIVFEDEATYYRFAYKCKIICMMQIPLYYYYQSPNSITRSKNFRLDFFRICEDRVIFFNQQGDSDLIDYAYERYAITLILNHSKAIAKSASKEIKKEIVSKFHSVFPYINKRSVSWDRKILFQIYLLFTKLTAWLISKVK